MTVRVIAKESCSATHLLSVSQKRSRRYTELLHEGPQWPLRVGPNLPGKHTELSIQAHIDQLLRSLGPPFSRPQMRALTLLAAYLAKLRQ